MISVGIDIGNFSIKVVEIDASLKPFSVTQFKEFPLSQDPNKDRKIEIIDILRGLTAQYEGMPVHFVLGIPEWKTSIRRKIFPFKERHKILKSLPFELEDDIPFSQDDSIFDAKIVRYIGNAAEVIALACPEETVAERVQLAKDIGFDLNVLSVEGLTLPNLFTSWWEPPPQEQPLPEEEEETDFESDASAETVVSRVEPVNQLRMHLHLGHETTIALFFSGQVLKAIRNIDWGGRQLAEAISRKYSMHYIDALKEVQKKAFLLTDNEGANKDQITFSDTLKDVVDGLVQDLRLTIIELESELSARVSSAEFSGGVAQMKNLGPYMTQKLERPCNRFVTFKFMPSVQVGVNPQVEAIAPIAIGLAIEGIKKPRNPAVNLLKGRFSKQGQGIKPLWNKWGHTIKIGATALIFLFIWSSFRTDQARFMADEVHYEMKALAQKVAGLSRSQAGSVSSISKFLRDQERLEMNRQSAEKVNNIVSAMEILQSISSALPSASKVDVKALSIDNELAIVQGEVDTASAAQLVKTSLERLSADKKVRTRPPTFAASPGKRVFGFQFSIKRLEDEQ